MTKRFAARSKNDLHSLDRDQLAQVSGGSEGSVEAPLEIIDVPGENARGFVPGNVRGQPAVNTPSLRG